MSLTLTLAVHDLERTAAFYRGVLELPAEFCLPAPGHPPLLLLPQGDATILFRERIALEARHPALFQDLDRRALGIGMTLEFAVADLAPLLRNIHRRQLHLVYELQDDESGLREIWLHDPDGYLVILSEPPQEKRVGSGHHRQVRRKRWPAPDRSTKLAPDLCPPFT